MSGFTKTITSLDNRLVSFSAQFVTPETVTTLTGEGMPNLKVGGC